MDEMYIKNEGGQRFLYPLGDPLLGTLLIKIINIVKMSILPKDIPVETFMTFFIGRARLS